MTDKKQQQLCSAGFYLSSSRAPWIYYENQYDGGCCWCQQCAQATTSGYVCRRRRTVYINRWMYDAFGGWGDVAFLHIIRGERERERLSTSKTRRSVAVSHSQASLSSFNDGALSGLPRLTLVVVIIGFDSKSNTLTQDTHTTNTNPTRRQ